LYHYTHRQSLVACAQIFSQVAESPVKEIALRNLLKLLQSDCSSRSSLDPENPHAGKLLMSQDEPTEFENLDAAQQGIFGRSISSEKIRTSSGEELPGKELVKCCVAIRIPVVMCTPGKFSGSQNGLVLVNADRLDREIKRVIAAQEKIQVEKIQKEESKKKCCFPWPFGRKSNESRFRSKSRQAGEREGEEKLLGDKQNSKSIEEILAKKKRAIRVKQIQDEMQADTLAHLQKINGYDSVINACREAKSPARSKSRSASQKKRMSVVSANEQLGKAYTGERKNSKLGLDLEAIVLGTDDSKKSDRHALIRQERTACTATLKARGGWKDLSKRQAMSQQMQ